MTTTHTIPTVDISRYLAGDEAGTRDVVRQIDQSCRSVGFLIITGHGVYPDLVAAARAASMDFFALSLQQKLAYKMPPDRYRGYTSPGTESLAAS